MSFFNPGIDSGHIIKSAVNARGLGALSREEDAYQLKFHPNAGVVRHVENVTPGAYSHYGLPIYSIPISWLKEHEYQETLKTLDPAQRKTFTDNIIKQYRFDQKANSQQMSQDSPLRRASSGKIDLDSTKSYFSNKTPYQTLQALGIGKMNMPEGTVLTHYKWPSSTYSFKSAGINESELLQGVDTIAGNCDLTASSLENLGSVKTIEGSLTIPIFTKLKDLSGVQVNGDIICPADSVASVKNMLKSIGFDFSNFKGILRLA